MKTLLAFTLLLGLVTSPAARAATVEITYTLSAVYTLAGVGELGPETLGSMTVAYPASGSPPSSSTTGPGGFPTVNIPHGPVHLSIASLPPLNVNVTIGGDLITGVLSPPGPFSSIPGSLKSTGALTLGPFNVWDLGLLHCVGLTCPALGFLATSVPQPFTVGLSVLFLSFPNAATPGSNLNLSFTGTATIGTLLGYNVVAVLRGQEVGRHITPEPGGTLILGIGLLGLALAGAVGRARRARR